MTPECNELWDKMYREYPGGAWFRPKSQMGVGLHEKLCNHFKLEEITPSSFVFIYSLRLRYWALKYQDRFEQWPDEILTQDKLDELKHDFENSQK